MAGPEVVDARIVSVETLLDAGRPGDAHNPDVRSTIATTLAQQMHILVHRPELVAAGRDAPAWCRYQGGPWPTPRDSFFDFRVTPDGWAWLDEAATEASQAVLRASVGDEKLAVAHADWYCGNLGFYGAQLVACADWDLVTDTVAVVAGLTAGFHSHGTTAGDEQAEPAEVATFLSDFEQAYGARFYTRQQRAAAAAATWSICYAARCQLHTLDGEPQPGSPLAALRRHRTEYLKLHW